MENYILPVMSAVIIFPFLAGLFTIPYILFQYHKYGAIPVLRVIIVYSFILYLTSAYFLVILPLPSISEVSAMTGPSYQIVPFQFIADFINNTSLVITEPSTYLKALKEPYIYQWLYNIFLTVPFGIYLRYYFKCSFKKTITLTFMLTLFFEVTQLTGLYGIYPRSYRLFDVDDLFLNTLGGVVGYLLTPIVEKILPTREELDKMAYQKGMKISGFRRLTSFFLDIFIFMIYTIIVNTIIQTKIEIPGGIYSMLSVGFILYYLVIPIFNEGRTLGKHFLKIRIISTTEKPAKWYQIIYRNILLYLMIIPIPYYLLYGAYFIGSFFHWGDFSYSIAFILIIALSFGFYLFMFTKGAIRKKLLIYERLSKTKNVSTIKEKELFDPNENQVENVSFKEEKEDIC